MLGRPRMLAIASALAMGVAWLTEAAPAGASEAVLVKLRREGPHALRACAEALTRNGRERVSHVIVVTGISQVRVSMRVRRTGTSRVRVSVRHLVTVQSRVRCS